MSKGFHKVFISEKSGKSTHTNSTGRVGVEHTIKLGTVVITDLRVLPGGLSELGEISADKSVVVESVAPGFLTCDVSNSAGETISVSDGRFVIEFSDSGIKVYS